MGGIFAGYDLDSGMVWVPPYLKGVARSKWLQERGLALVKGSPGAAVPAGPGAYSLYEMMQPFVSSDAVTVSSANVETILTQDALLTLPANFFAFPGKVCQFHAAGKMSNVVTTPGTVTFRLRYNLVGGTLLVASGAISPDPVAATDNFWFCDIFIKCVAMTAGTTPTITLLAGGEVSMANAAYTLANSKAMMMPPGQTSLANVAGLDGTVPKALTLTAQPTLSTLTVTCRDVWITALN